MACPKRDGAWLRALETNHSKGDLPGMERRGLSQQKRDKLGKDTILEKM